MSNSAVTPCTDEQLQVLPRRHLLLCLALLWTSGTALRLTILAVPPLLPLIRGDLHLSATAVGFLTSLPVALFALAALPGSFLIRRLGLITTLVSGLLLVAVGAALRGASVHAGILFATTVLMGLGVAIMQPTMPAIVRAWLPSRVGFATATYSNGLVSGEILAAFLTVPFVLSLVHGSWRLALAIWAIPVALTALAVTLWAPRTSEAPVMNRSSSRHWSADWKLIWRLGILFGTCNSMYFATNAFLPIYLSHAGRADLIRESLTAMNFAQVPASLVVLGLAARLERRSWPYYLLGALSLLSVAGLVYTIGPWTIVWAALLGFCCAGVLVLGLMLPALLVPPEEVAHTSAAMFTISYASAMVIAVVSGAAWDLSGIPRLAFAPIGLCALTLLGATLVLRFRQELL